MTASAEKMLRVRFRIDGMLKHKTDLPLFLAGSLITRLRAISQMDLEMLGFSPANLALYKQILEIPSGIIMATGPSGSGKSTTVYASLRNMNVSDKKIVPVSDCAFTRCTAHEGGIFLYNSQDVLANCTFEHCRAGVSGGGLYVIGGAGIHASAAELDRCTFERCTTRHIHGGGFLCAESDPLISACRFLGCSAGRGGGIYRDSSSAPRVVNTTFTGCTPHETNFTATGAASGNRDRFL